METALQHTPSTAAAPVTTVFMAAETLLVAPPASGILAAVALVCVVMKKIAPVMIATVEIRKMIVT